MRRCAAGFRSTSPRFAIATSHGHRGARLLLAAYATGPSPCVVILDAVRGRQRPVQTEVLYGARDQPASGSPCLQYGRREP